ncbi:hypothetical protein EHZ19_31780 [Paraburkholderia bannensis]|nr:hypothetical protein EHZ19_31780 [Paraburkholderia bannensis]
MKFYPEGDLTSLCGTLSLQLSSAEIVFNLMIDCIAELHTRHIYHRDIKPQNFLREGGNIVVSDLGLGAEIGSLTRFTGSSQSWGTAGYFPPEFARGGFKNATEASDIFMLGKSFYYLLTGCDPTFMMDDGIPPQLFHVIERACDHQPSNRYKDLAALRQALTFAFDAILGRGGIIGKISQLIEAIQANLTVSNRFYPQQIIEFIETLPMVDRADQIRICYGLGYPFMTTLVQGHIVGYVPQFLAVYQVMVEDAQYNWSFAETIALNMKVIFDANGVPDKTKALALEIAIDAASRMNRFAAMDTCIAMICSVTDAALGMQVAGVMQRKEQDFITGIEPSQTKTDPIRRYLWAVKNRS